MVLFPLWSASPSCYLSESWQAQGSWISTFRSLPSGFLWGKWSRISCMRVFPLRGNMKAIEGSSLTSLILIQSQGSCFLTPWCHVAPSWWLGWQRRGRRVWAFCAFVLGGRVGYLWSAHPHMQRRMSWASGFPSSGLDRGLPIKTTLTQVCVPPPIQPRWSILFPSNYLCWWFVRSPAGWWWGLPRFLSLQRVHDQPLLTELWR